MVYKISVSPRAQKEIIDTIDYYTPHNPDVPNNFIVQLLKIYGILETNPFFRLRYKNVRALKLKKFPYSLYYTVNETQKLVKVLSCFHNKRNPKKRPRG
jgi:toxin ParE1/3/4